jgi:sterol desaturase/sphingolipid hydroxylase (fatty acid hydroxylase superfamily)
MKLEDALILAIPVTYLLMFAVERRYPARQFTPVNGWTYIGAAFMVAFMSLAVITPLLLPVDWLAAHRLVDGSKLGPIGGIIPGFVAVELGVYAYHRACHRFQFMWRAFHQVHHSAERIDMPGSVVFHPLELLSQNTLAILITVLLLGLDPIAAALAGYLVTFAALFQHWNVHTPRWLGYIIQRPEAHCLHHAFHLHAYNYADLPLIDMLFGTFRNPASFSGRVGFEQKPAFGKMLLGIDISRGDGTRHLKQDTPP